MGEEVYPFHDGVLGDIAVVQWVGHGLKFKNRRPMCAVLYCKDYIIIL